MLNWSLLIIHREYWWLQVKEFRWLHSSLQQQQQHIQHRIRKLSSKSMKHMPAIDFVFANGRPCCWCRIMGGDFDDSGNSITEIACVLSCDLPVNYTRSGGAFDFMALLFTLLLMCTHIREFDQLTCNFVCLTSKHLVSQQFSKFQQVWLYFSSPYYFRDCRLVQQVAQQAKWPYCACREEHSL